MRLSRFKLAAVALAASIGTAHALERIDVAHFGPPSFGAFLPPVIKAHKFDEKNGLSLQFHALTPDAYTSAFNSGQYQVSASAASLTIGLSDVRGVQVVNLFNVFDFWCAVVTSRPEIKTIKDLEGREIAAAKGTTSYVMFEWLAKQQGVDVSKLSVVNTATPGLIGYALADRAEAVQLWEPAYTMLKARKPEIRSLDLNLEKTWREFAGSPNIPYQGVAAHRRWIEKNPALVPKLFAAYREAGQWLVANPDEAANLILPKATPEERKALAELIRSPERLGLNVKWAHELKSEIGSLYRLGREIGLLPTDPSPRSIYMPAAR